MLVLNGVDCVDNSTSNPLGSWLTSTLRGQRDLLFYHDGTRGPVPPMDGISRTLLTTTGGCSGSFASSDNYRTMLGCLAPVVAGARDNLLSAEDSSFEGGTVGNWTSIARFSLAVDSTQAYHGSKSLQATVTSEGPVGSTSAGLNIKTVTSADTQYTLSAWVKASNTNAVGKKYRLDIYGNSSGHTTGTNITLTTEWQRMTVTKTFNAGDTTTRYCYFVNGDTSVAGDIILVDAIQLEAGATASPFCVDYADAATLSIPTATIGLGVGPTTYLIAFNAPWSGADGVLHTLFDCGSVKCYKSAANNLTLEITDGAAGTKTMAGAVTAVNMAADTTHIVICKHDGAGTLSLKLNGTALTTAAGAGTGIPAAPGATLYWGTDTAGANPLNGAIEGAVYGRRISEGEDAYLGRMTQWLPSLRSVA